MMSDHDLMVRVKDLKVYFPAKTGGVLDRIRGKQRFIKAVDGVELEIHSGRTLALVGESGCGKSTLGRVMVGLTKPTAGTLEIKGKNIDLSDRRFWRDMRRDVQFIFQDPTCSLNPRMRVLDIIGRPIGIFESVSKEEKKRRVEEPMEKVGLPANRVMQYPHEFSGGQKQRISIARALSVSPSLIIADEPTAALDVSVQCQILNLLMDIKKELGLTMLFISHDLDVVRYISDEVAIMYLGQIVEYGRTEEIFSKPGHVYTKALLGAVPAGPGGRHRERIRLTGSMENIGDISGCKLHPRCPFASERCKTECPEFRDIGGGHKVACFKAQCI